jgi:septum formation protein
LIDSMSGDMSSITTQPELILASTSRYRQELLARLGVPFRCAAPKIDEELWKGRGLPPQQLAETLAQAKGESLVADFPQAIILGSDQVCEVAGETLSKPGSPERACEQLRRLSGTTHRLFTAVAVWSAGKWQTHIDVTELTMRSLTNAEIERYVAADEPWDCAGSYKFESRGIALFTAVRSEEPTAITGLPLLAVAQILRECGCRVP